MKKMLLLLITNLLVSSMAYAQSSIEEPWRFGAGLSLRLGQQIKSDISASSISSSVTASGEVKLNIKTQAAIEIEARYMRSYNWGFQGGISHALAADVKSGSVTLNGVTTAGSPSADPDKVSITTLYANAVYRWDSLYIPFGLNLSVIDYDANGAEFTPHAGFGIQFGVGYMIHDNISIEITRSATDYEADFLDSGVFIYLRDGFLTSYNLSVKYIF